ncbi:MAG: 2-amino-4-hydroxy-6-hydroxymethyldihydropteridine diphosphokinase, partial [Myxococcales bacterium]
MGDVASRLPVGTFVVALGTNLGDRHGHLAAAAAAIDALPGTRLLARSRLRETDPVGGPPQGPFLNGAVLLATTLPPLDLLAHLLAIEQSRG